MLAEEAFLVGEVLFDVEAQPSEDSIAAAAGQDTIDVPNDVDVLALGGQSGNFLPSLLNESLTGTNLFRGTWIEKSLVQTLHDGYVSST